MKESSSPQSWTDQVLVDRARSGDVGAKDELVSRHHASVYRVALGILKEEEGAADVTQETFLKAFRGLDRFRGDASFKTWLLTIAANEAKGVLRKALRRKEIPLEGVAPASSPEASAEEVLEGKEGASWVRELLNHLPEKQRQAVSLRIFEDLSFREIGIIIGSSEGAARVNYHHGIRRLKERLGQEGQD